MRRGPRFKISSKTTESFLNKTIVATVAIEKDGGSSMAIFRSASQKLSSPACRLDLPSNAANESGPRTGSRSRNPTWLSVAIMMRSVFSSGGSRRSSFGALCGVTERIEEGQENRSGGVRRKKRHEMAKHAAWSEYTRWCVSMQVDTRKSCGSFQLLAGRDRGMGTTHGAAREHD